MYWLHTKTFKDFSPRQSSISTNSKPLAEDLLLSYMGAARRNEKLSWHLGLLSNEHYFKSIYRIWVTLSHVVRKFFWLRDTENPYVRNIRPLYLIDLMSIFCESSFIRISSDHYKKYNLETNRTVIKKS